VINHEPSPPAVDITQLLQDWQAGSREALDRLARALVRLGQNDCGGALRLLHRAGDSREFGLVTIGVDPRMAPLRQSTKSQQLLGRVGLT